MVYAATVGDEFTNLLGNVVAVAIKVIIFLLIVVVGWIIASWLHKWITRGLQRLNFDRAVERGGLRRPIGQTSPSELASRLVVFAFMLFVLQLAFGVFGPNPVSDLIKAVIAWLPKLFVAVIIVVVAAAVAGWVRELVTEMLGGVNYGKAVAVTAQVLILVLGIIAGLNQVGVAVTVTLPILIAGLATVAGILIVGAGGGLIKPMQDRWERVLNRAEAQTALAAEQLRARRGATKDSRDRNAPAGIERPSYGGGETPIAEQPTAEQPTAEQPGAEPPGDPEP